MDGRFLLDCTLKLALSLVCGLILGMERRSRQQVVGMRTLILISVSSTLLSILSKYMAVTSNVSGDPTRIAAGVVSGIGFLGGGAILHQGLDIKGLTSAAIIWAASVIGLSIGAGLILPSVIALILVLLALVLLEKVEERFFPAEESKTFHIVYQEETVELDKVRRIIEDNGFIVKNLNISRVTSVKQIILRYKVRAPREAYTLNLFEELKTLGTLSEFSVTD